MRNKEEVGDQEREKMGKKEGLFQKEKEKHREQKKNADKTRNRKGKDKERDREEMGEQERQIASVENK